MKSLILFLTNMEDIDIIISLVMANSERLGEAKR